VSLRRIARSHGLTLGQLRRAVVRALVAEVTRTVR
jgi:hypothetical protein